MSGQFGGSITSADNGTNIPDDDGFEPGGDFYLDVLQATTINGFVQMQDDNGGWADVPGDGEELITANYSKLIGAAPGDRFRMAIVTVTGTAYWAAKRKLQRTF